MTGCCVSRKCKVACFLGEESQQPTWPHDLHSRNSTHTDPSARHSSHALGVFGGGNFSAVSPLMCSHASAINISCHWIAILIYRPSLRLLPSYESFSAARLHVC